MLSKARHIELAVALMLALLLFAFSPPTEPRIRWIGMTMQLVGIGTVIWGIAETRSFFGRIGFTTKLLLWVRRRLGYRGKTNTGFGRGQLSITAKGRGHHTKRASSADAPLDERVRVLEQNLTLVSNRIESVEKQIEAEVRDRDSAIAREKGERLRHEVAIHQKIEDAATGGVHISAIGAVYLFLGVILGSTSPELSNWLL